MDPEHKRRLQRQRKNLLENISDYDGIITGLFSEEILTAAMKERVEKPSGSDRLREILDILPKRGPRAFDVFYNVLVECGEGIAADFLCPERAVERKSKAGQKPSMQESSAVSPPLPEDEELPTKWPDQNSHDPFSVEVTKVPEGDGGMKTRFDRARECIGSVYAMHNAFRGICLLISNVNFEKARSNGENLDDRAGTDRDTIALDNLFQQLHFKVVSKEDQSAQEMVQVVKTQAVEVKPTDNCFVCCVLTHGERGKVYGVDGKTADLDELKAAVADNCQSLIGKPKLFFIQACQGKKFDGAEPAAKGKGDTASEEKGAGGEEEDKDLHEATAKMAGVQLRDTTKSDAASDGQPSPRSDTFVAMATVPDFVSWRNTNWGTWFVQAIAYIFSRFAYKYDINQLMTRVNKLVSRAETSKGYKQVSIYNSSLTSDFYFFPGLQHSIMESHSEVDIGKSNVTPEKPAPDQSASQESVPQQKTHSGSILSQPSEGV